MDGRFVDGRFSGGRGFPCGGRGSCCGGGHRSCRWLLVDNKL